MHTFALIECLIAIGRASANGDHPAVETLVVEAQNLALQLERDLVDALQEKARLQAIKAAFPAF
jgi:hypothetical protein